jgi:hypothetical protein
MSKPIPISNSYSIVNTNSKNDLNKIEPIKLGSSAPGKLGDNIIENYLQIKAEEIKNSDSPQLPILGSSPILKPEGIAGKSITSLKNLLNFKL